MAKFVCTVCGYVYEGEAAPAECPICHAPAEKFVKQEGEMTWASEHVVGVAKGVSEDILADLRANFEGECSEVGMYLAMARVAHREGYPEIGMYYEKAAYEEAEHAAKFAELLGEVVTDSTKKNLEMRVEAENGATAGKTDLAKRAKSAFNLVQNEALGHYSISNSVSMDMLEDEYGMALASAPSAEDLLMEQEDTNETVATFVELVSSVIEKSPKIGYAVLLLHTGVKGEEFYGKMRLTHGPANRVRQEAESILKDGLANFDVNSITGYKNQFNDVYKEEAYALLNAIVEMFK